jgi:hypothetical protein
MVVVNVVFRLLVVVTGILIIVGFAPFNTFESPLHEIFGTVVVLFGVYRLVTYSSVIRRNTK